MALEPEAAARPAHFATLAAELDRVFSAVAPLTRPWRARWGTAFVAVVSAISWCLVAGTLFVVSACAGQMPDRELSLLGEINTSVNTTVQYVAEVDGRNEWRIAETEGDCEDFAIRKRRDLIRRGFPALDLSIVIVPGHAMLVARTPTGAYVLDNRTDKIVRWDGAGREYLPLGAMWLPRDYVLRLARKEADKLEMAATIH